MARKTNSPWRLDEAFVRLAEKAWPVDIRRAAQASTGYTACSRNAASQRMRFRFECFEAMKAPS